MGHPFGFADINRGSEGGSAHAEGVSTVGAVEANSCEQFLELVMAAVIGNRGTCGTLLLIEAHKDGAGGTL